MGTAQYSASILYVLKALLQSPFWVVVMAKSMWHTNVTFHGNFVPSLAQELTIILPFVSFQVKLSGDDMSWRQILEIRSQHRSAYPVV